MVCARHRESIHELVDGTLGAIRRAELQQHLDECANCRALLADLQFVHDSAASLDELAAPQGVWLQVAGRLRQEGRAAAPPAPAPSRRLHAGLLAIAAALTIAIGASLMLLLRDNSTATPQSTTASAPVPGNASGQAAVQSIADDIRLAEQHYQNAISKLEQIAQLDPASDDATIDPQTAAALQKGLTVIDQAIAESRAALRTEPQSAPARDSLFDALKRKVALLQDTVVLMNEMRKGNSAGAAQIVDGLNKS
jgi:anti-sigma factor RsiW